MQKLIRSSLLLVVLASLVVAGTGCSRQAKTARALAKADGYFAAGRYDEAEIEYKNVLQLQSFHPAAIAQLGVIYFDQTRLIPARIFLLKAGELSPENLEVRLKLGLIDLALQDFAGARTKAGFILDREPKNEGAPLLLAEASIEPKDVEESRLRLKKLPPTVQESAPVQVALGLLEMRQNHAEAAQENFKRALGLNPKSAEAHAAMGVVYSIQKNLPLAEQELKQAADLSPPRSSWRIQYAQFKIQHGDPAAGRKILVQMTQQTPDYLPAWMRLAQQASLDGKYDEALAFVGRVLARDSTYPEALLLESRLRLAKGESAKAVAILEKSLKIYPASPQILHQLGLAYVAAGDFKKAIAVLKQALVLAPGYTDATVLLATLNMRMGDPDTSFSALVTVVRQHPELLQPRLLLAEAYRAKNNPADALAVYDAIEKDFPCNPQTPLPRGMILLAQKKPAEARQAFTQALERTPDSLPAVEQLVNLDMMDKQFSAARRRVDALIEKQPKSPGPQMLLAKVLFAEKNTDQAEAALLKAIELQPDAPAAYYLLAGLHMASHQQEKALASFQQILTKNPNDARALMMTGLLSEQLKSYDKALAAYEKLLTINPKSGIALNNAAVLYSEHFNQLDKALAAAQKAREFFPNEPHLADTLGWILVKKRQIPWALGLLQESADKLPESSEVQYHLGIAHYLNGNEELARAALERAVGSGREFSGLDDARKHLAVLGIAVDKAGPAERTALESVLAGSPDDPVALSRLAAIHERAGDLDKAIDAYQDAVKASPTNVPAMLSLARIYSLKKDPTKALEQAKAARKVAPDNPAAALALGRLSYQTRDYPYAYSLLQESARKRPDDAEGLRDLARAAYSVGHVAEAETAMQQSLQLDALSAGANEARNFLELTALAEDPVQAAAAGAKIAQILKSVPKDVPALMAAATASEQKSDASGAMATYEKVLEQFPDFTPAKKRLAILYAANAGDNKKAFDLALKARAAYPEDAELAQAFGVILYRQGDFPRALTLLKESVAKRREDAELSYYLGMTQYRLKDTKSAKQSLQRALDLKLKPELAADARKTVAELK